MIALSIWMRQCDYEASEEEKEQQTGMKTTFDFGKSRRAQNSST